MDIADALTALKSLDDKDAASMGTVDWTERALDFLKIAHKYMPDTRYTDRCMWSCRNGKEKALESKRTTDMDVPFIKALFQATKSDGKITPECTRHSLIISCLYAWHCKGDVHVYMGSDKKTEPTGFHIGNNFWDAELPVLRLIHKHGGLKNIFLYIYLSDSGWYKVNLVDSDGLWNSLPLWRRHWHPMDAASTKPSFVHADMTQEDYDKWRTAPPRKYITVSIVKRIIRKWRMYKRM